MSQNQTQSMSLKRAIDKGDLEEVKVLVSGNHKLTSEPIAWGPVLCRCRTEPLHYLSDGPFNQLWDHGRQADIARVLLEAGAPVDGLPTSGETPLHGAASLGEPDVARVLLEFGADIEKTAAYPGMIHGTPLEFAVHFGMVRVVDVLVEKGARILSARMAAGAGMLDLLIEKVSFDEEAEVFRCACVCGRTEIVDYLLGKGLDVNIEVKGASGLHWAAWEAKPALVRFLLEKGANGDCRDKKHKMTAAEWAKHRRKELGPRWGHDEVLEVLSTT